MELKEMQDKKHQLEMEKAVLESDIKTKSQELADMKKEMEANFGTSDITRLKEIRDELQKAIEEAEEQYTKLINEEE